MLAELDGESWLMASLLYGSGLRLTECLQLRVQDVEFGRGELAVRDGKGNKDRVTMLPESLKAPLREQFERARRVHQARSGRRMGPGGAARRARAASTRTLPPSGAGSGCSRSSAGGANASDRRAGEAPRAPDGAAAGGEGGGATVGSRRSAPGATRSGTRSRRTCSRPATTSGRSRSCSATRA